MQIITFFFQLLVAHTVADFVLQQESMGSGKNRHNDIHNRASNNFPPWYYWMTAHAIVHGGAVYIVTDSLLLGSAEIILHWIIDFSKCEGWINFHQDQALHMGCKLGYCFFI